MIFCFFFVQVTAAGERGADVQIQPLPVHPTSAAQPKRPRAVDVSARMLEAVRHDPERLLWSARRWGSAMGCAAGTICGTPAWREIQALNAEQRADAVATARQRQKGGAA